MKKTPSYYQAVYDVVSMIPPGRVSTYGHIADFLSLGSARMVGYALRQSSDIKIPAHRVVNSQGVLTGKRNFRPPNKMIVLLEKEGIQICNDRVMNFEKKIWIPFQAFNKG